MTVFYVVSEANGKQESTHTSYKTQRGAEKLAERMNAQHPGYFKQIVVTSKYYADVLCKRTTTVRNLMTDTDVEIRLVDEGGPCDPSTERYFSM